MSTETNTVAPAPRVSVINTQGTEATNFKATLKAASLDFDVMEDKVGGMDTGIEMPRKKLLYRSDTKLPLGIVGEDYESSCPREFLKAQFEFADFIKGKVIRAGFMDERARAFAFTQLEDITVMVSRDKRKVGDVCKCYIYSTDGWDGGTPRRSRLYIERLRCTNGMTSKEIKASLWVSHTKSMEQRYEVRWKKFLEEIRKQTEVIRNEFQTLAKTRMTEAEAKEFFEKLMPGDSGRTIGVRDELLLLFNAGDGNQGSTRWDGYNAVTEYVTHNRTYRETDATSSSTNRFLGVLETDTLSRRALELLVH